MGGAVASTGMTALMLGGLAWSFFALAVLALACYVALLAQLTARRTEAAVKLHRLPQRRRVQDLQAQLLVPQAVGETGSVRLRRWEH